MKPILYSLFILLVMVSCSKSKAPETKHRSDFHLNKVDKSAFEKTEQVYIPIYSDIYYLDSKHTFSLTATLSIRNTSFQGIMIGTTGQQGIFFTTEGIVIQQ